MIKFKDIADVENLFQTLEEFRIRRMFTWRESVTLAQQVLDVTYRTEKEAITALHQHFNPPSEPRECNCSPANGTRWMVSPVLIHYNPTGEQFPYLPLIQEAVRQVMEACGIDIQFTSDAREAHIGVTNEALDGRGGTLGQAYQPVSGDDMAACGPMCGNISIDTGERWNRSFFLTVFIHELLHALGLPHNPDRRSIMYPAYTGPRGLHALDIAELLRRYPKRVFTA